MSERFEIIGDERSVGLPDILIVKDNQTGRYFNMEYAEFEALIKESK